LKLLYQCKQRSTTIDNTIQGIKLVSTVYSQPPLPFRRLNEENDKMKVTSTEVYDKIVHIDDQITVMDVLPNLHPY
jgi:hypothetical protein